MWSANKIHGGVLLYILICLGITVLIFASLDWISFVTLDWFSVSEEENGNETSETIVALVWLAFTTFLFGAIVAPIGKGFSAWLTPWDILLILGGIPLFFVISNLVDDIAVTKLAKSLV